MSPAMISPPGHQACSTLSLCVLFSGYIVAESGLIEISTSPFAQPVKNAATHSTQKLTFSAPANGNSDQWNLSFIHWEAFASDVAIGAAKPIPVTSPAKTVPAMPTAC